VNQPNSACCLFSYPIISINATIIAEHHEHPLRLATIDNPAIRNMLMMHHKGGQTHGHAFRAKHLNLDANDPAVVSEARRRR
jgi:hypothetical protein